MPGDDAALAVLMEEMQAHYGVPCPPRATILGGISTLPPGVEILVAEIGGLVGFAAISTLYPGPGLAPGFFLKDLFVTRAARGSGIGSALMRRVAAIAVERGYTRVDWTATRANGQLLAFYDGCGAARQEERVFYRLAGAALEALARRKPG